MTTPVAKNAEDLRKVVGELVECDNALRAASKETSALRKRRSELKKEILEFLIASEMDEIVYQDLGVTLSLRTTEKARPLTRDEVVKAVSKVLKTSNTEDGERVFAEADRARPTTVHNSLGMKKSTAKTTQQTGAEDELDDGAAP